MVFFFKKKTTFWVLHRRFQTRPEDHRLGSWNQSGAGRRSLGAVGSKVGKGKQSENAGSTLW